MHTRGAGEKEDSWGVEGVVESGGRSASFIFTSQPGLYRCVGIHNSLLPSVSEYSRV